MKGKWQIELSFICVVILIIVSWIGILIYENIKIDNMDTFIEFVELAEVDLVVRQQLIDYEPEIINRVEEAKSRIELRQVYFALGQIEKLKGNYEKSNNYFYKVTNLGELKHHKLNVMLYQSISSNYFKLNNREKSQEYFLKAEAIANGYGEPELLALVYRSRAFVLVNHEGLYAESINLLQRAIYISQDPLNQIESNLQLADIYMNLFSEDSAMTCLLKALELSIENNVEPYQKFALISFGTAYNISSQYEKAIDSFEICFSKWPDYHTIYYIAPLLISYFHLEGLESALNQLESYKPYLLRVVFDNNEKKLDMWSSTMKSRLYNLDNQPELALQYWQDGVTQVDHDLTQSYSQWRQYIYLTIQAKLGAPVSQILQQYEVLYDFLESNVMYPSLKLKLIEDMVKYSISLGNYELAYQFMSQRVDHVVEAIPEGIRMEDIYTWIDHEIDLTSFEQRRHDFLKGFIHTVLWVGSIYMITYYRRKTRIFKSRLDKKRMTDPLTSTLTLPAFYQSIEKWIDSNQEIPFLSIDIDYFEKYNQTYGLLAGDMILEQISYQIKQFYPHGFITRINGCEFIVAVQAERDEISLKTQQLIDSIYDLNLNHLTNLDEERITISIGINIGTINSKVKVDKRIELARRCLREAKQKGRNTFVI